MKGEHGAAERQGYHAGGEEQDDLLVRVMGLVCLASGQG